MLMLNRHARLREDLVARLLRQITAAHGEDRDDPVSILRTCMGLALDHDLTDQETQWLLSAVEGSLDVHLTPMA